MHSDSQRERGRIEDRETDRTTEFSTLYRDFLISTLDVGNSQKISIDFATAPKIEHPFSCLRHRCDSAAWANLLLLLPPFGNPKTGTDCVISPHLAKAHNAKKMERRRRRVGRRHHLVCLRSNWAKFVCKVRHATHESCSSCPIWWFVCWK